MSVFLQGEVSDQTKVLDYLQVDLANVPMNIDIEDAL
jgi:hypothetical protein